MSKENSNKVIRKLKSTAFLLQCVVVEQLSTDKIDENKVVKFQNVISISKAFSDQKSFFKSKSLILKITIDFPDHQKFDLRSKFHNRK